MQEYTGFVYQWVNKSNQKKYIGSHFGKIDDGYIGSGLYFRRAYDANATVFERTILEFVNGSRKDVIFAEDRWLKSINNIVQNDEYYNLTASAGGGLNHEHLSDIARSAIYEKMVQASQARRAAMTPDEQEELAEAKRLTWCSKPEQTAAHSIRSKQRRVLEEQNKTEQVKEAFRVSCSSTYWARTEEELATAHANQSAGITAWHASLSHEKKKARVDNMKATKRARKLKYIHNQSTSKIKQVPEADLGLWISNGWVKGMGLKRSKNV